MVQQRTPICLNACTKNPHKLPLFWYILPFWTVRTSSTSSWNSMPTWRTTLLFFWPISAARKGHLEARAWPEGGTGWPAGSLDSPASLGATFKEKHFVINSERLDTILMLGFCLCLTYLHLQSSSPQCLGGREMTRMRMRSRGPVPLSEAWA